MISFDIVLSAFTAILMTIEPTGLIPLFLAITAGMTREERARTAIQSAIIAYLVLVVVALCGNFILFALGITIPAFRIAGGLLLLYIAWEMVFATLEKEKQETTTTALSSDFVRNLAAFPLAIPLISGPAAISTTMLFSGKMSGFTSQMILLAIITVCMAITYLFMALAQRIDPYLSKAARSVLTRIVGLLLAAMATQFILNGLMEGLHLGSFGKFS